MSGTQNAESLLVTQAVKHMRSIRHRQTNPSTEQAEIRKPSNKAKSKPQRLKCWKVMNNLNLRSHSYCSPDGLRNTASSSTLRCPTGSASLRDQLNKDMKAVFHFAVVLPNVALQPLVVNSQTSHYCFSVFAGGILIPVKLLCFQLCYLECHHVVPVDERYRTLSLCDLSNPV